MSRINPTKGLLNLAFAWKQVTMEFRDWCLVIAGPDEMGHISEVQAALGGTERVHFLGALTGDERLAAYAAAELFVLPTLSESFGLVVAEALAAGVPVITTKGAPWQELEEHGCGWWIDIGSEPLEAALRRALLRTSDELAVMGIRGRNLVVRKYSWSTIGREMISVYKWILGQGECPPCVQKEGALP